MKILTLLISLVAFVNIPVFSAESNLTEHDEIFKITKQFATALSNNKQQIQMALQTPRLNEQQLTLRNQIGKITIKERNYDLKCINTVISHSHVVEEKALSSFGLEIHGVSELTNDYHRIAVLSECGKSFVTQATIFLIKLDSSENKVDNYQILNSVTSNDGLTQEDIDILTNNTPGITEETKQITEDYVPQIDGLESTILNQLKANSSW